MASGSEYGLSQIQLKPMSSKNKPKGCYTGLMDCGVLYEKSLEGNGQLFASPAWLFRLQPLMSGVLGSHIAEDKRGHLGNIQVSLCSHNPSN